MVFAFVFPLWVALTTTTTTTLFSKSTPSFIDEKHGAVAISIECGRDGYSSPLNQHPSSEIHNNIEEEPKQPKHSEFIMSSHANKKPLCRSSTRRKTKTDENFSMSRRDGLIQAFKSCSLLTIVSKCISVFPAAATASTSSTKLVNIYDKAATTYDELYGQSQVGKTLDLNEVRRKTLSFASGDVLELGVGTGLNLPFYPSSPKNDNTNNGGGGSSSTITSLTAMDISSEMLNRAKQKQNLLPESLSSGGKISFQVGDVSQLPFEPETFDTVIDTFGLCVFENPVLVVKEAYRVLKPGGSLLLAETDDSIPSRIFGTARINEVSKTCRPDDNVLDILKKATSTVDGGSFEIVQTETYAGGMFRRVFARKVS